MAAIITIGILVGIWVIVLVSADYFNRNVI